MKILLASLLLISLISCVFSKLAKVKRASCLNEGELCLGKSPCCNEMKCLYEGLQVSNVNDNYRCGFQSDGSNDDHPEVDCSESSKTSKIKNNHKCTNNEECCSSFCDSEFGFCA